MVNVKHVNNMKKFNKKPFLNVRERIWFVIAFLIVRASSLFAQDPLAVSIVTIFDGEIKICNEMEYLQVNIDITNNTGYALETPELIINMPKGLEYEGCDTGLTYETPTGDEELRFTTVEIPQGANPMRFTFYLKGNCDFLEYLTAENGEEDEPLPKIFPSLQYTIGVTNYEVAEVNGSETFNVLFPSLNLQVNGDDTPQTPVRMDKHVFRHFTVENMGIESLTRLWIKVKLNSGLDIHNLYLITGQEPDDDVALSRISYSDNIAVYEIADFTQIGNNDPYFTASDGAITFKDEVEMVSYRDTASTFYYAEWGCDDARCNYSDAEASGVSCIISEIPNPVVTSTGSNGTYTITTSDGAIFDLKFKINLNELMTYPSQIYRLKHSNGSEITLTPVLIQNNNGINQYEIDLNDKYSYDPDGEGVGLDDVDGDKWYDDLPPGAQLSYVSPLDFTFSGQYYLTSCEEINSTEIVIRKQYLVGYKWDNSSIIENEFDFHNYEFGDNEYSQLKGDGDIDEYPKRLSFENKDFWMAYGSTEIKNKSQESDYFYEVHIIAPNEAYIIENISYWNGSEIIYLEESEITRENNIISFEVGVGILNSGFEVKFDISKNCDIILPDDPIFSKLYAELYYYFDRSIPDCYAKVLCKSYRFRK